MMSGHISVFILTLILQLVYSMCVSPEVKYCAILVILALGAKHMPGTWHLVNDILLNKVDLVKESTLRKEE